MIGDLRIPVEAIREAGLYLLFDDGRRVVLTRSIIDACTQRYLHDPALLSPACRAAAEYQPCAICPERHTAAICHAIPPVLPILDQLDCCLSCDAVTAVYRGEADPGGSSDPLLQVTRTTMQRALQYAAILGLMYYCETGRKYYKYWAGVVPLMDPQTLAERLYANLYLDLHGDDAAVQAQIALMRGELEVTIECQLKRLRLVSRGDAFVNAYANVHTALRFLEPWLLPELVARMAARNAPPAPPVHA